MTKINKRLLSLVIAVVMIISLLPASVMAEEAITLPEAKVTKMDKLSLTSYNVWNGEGFGSEYLTPSTEEMTLDAVVNFEALESLEECLQGGYADWKVDFNLTISGLENGSISSEGCYLAGNYGSFGWIVIPASVLTTTLYQGYAYPIVSNYEKNLTYKDICKSVKNFTAGLHVAPEVLAENPDLVLSLELVIYNETETYQVGDDILYTYTDLTETTLPQADVTVLGEMTLAANEYRTWNWVVSDEESETLVPGDSELPLEVVLNFKALDTLEECLTGGYAKWLVDFYVTVDGLKEGTIVADDCYMAGNYGSYGWIKIPLDGRTYENGVTYPVVANYDSTLNYKDICKSVQNFTAALHIDQAILDANPDMTVTLTLKMTNPNNANDTMQIGEAYVYDVDALSNGASAQNKETGELYTSAQDAINNAASGETVILLRDFQEDEIWVKSGKTLDLNGHCLTATDVSVTNKGANIVDSSNGDALLIVEPGSVAIRSDNAQLPVWVEEDGVSGYRFSSVSFHQGVQRKSTSKAYFYFWFEGEDANCMLAQQFRNGAVDNNITVRVTVAWKDAKGNDGSKSVVFSDELVKKYAENWLGNMFDLSVGGVDKVTDLQLTATVYSDINEDCQVAVNGGVSVVPAE